MGAAEAWVGIVPSGSHSELGLRLGDDGERSADFGRRFRLEVGGGGSVAGC